MIYRNLPKYSEQEINMILDTNDDKRIIQILLSIGEYCSDYDFATNIILEKFLSSDNDELRACCALSFSYLARRFKKMDANTISMLREELSKNNIWSGRVQDAIDDIEVFCSKH